MQSVHSTTRPNRATQTIQALHIPEALLKIQTVTAVSASPPLSANSPNRESSRLSSTNCHGKKWLMRSGAARGFMSRESSRSTTRLQGAAIPLWAVHLSLVLVVVLVLVFENPCKVQDANRE